MCLARELFVESWLEVNQQHPCQEIYPSRSELETAYLQWADMIHAEEE